ncbi:HIT family protein [Niveibacterium sp. 24ML]|uniref:HIT family protein n=1 Tax=Niveibacterium sp. 24ML TaxID=2985512 RepID=UPI0022715E56|nr:HIT family protein [Niveibacterium sp. 24ML]MCX9157689.1 HIT family protein [Niveibacterium sp. 24ML]
MHAPADYACPFCRVAAGGESQAEVFNDGVVIGVMGLHQPANHAGTVLVLPAQHFENTYELPDELAGRLMVASARIARALKVALGCEGVTLRQNNEPAGGQDVWHWHMHVIPRYAGDQYFQTPMRMMPLAERAALAARIRAAMDAAEPDRVGGAS